MLIAILLCVTACSKNEGTPEQKGWKTLDLPYSGVSFDLPEELENAKASFMPCYGTEMTPGSGIYVAGLIYCGVDKEKLEELRAKETLTDEEMTMVNSRMVEMVHVYGIDQNRTLDDIAQAMNPYGLDVALSKPLGSVGEYNYFYLVDPLKNYLDQLYVFDEGFKEEYDSLLKVLEDGSWIRIYEPQSILADMTGKQVSFETLDINGNTINSKDLFASSKLTMINIWGTYCGPCLSEMPDLEILNKRLKDKECAIIGVVADVQDIKDDYMVSTAKEIIEMTGVTYPNLLPWTDIGSQLNAPYIPTSYFVDSTGTIVGEAVVGAMGADEYELLFDEMLKQIKE